MGWPTQVQRTSPLSPEGKPVEQTLYSAAVPVKRKQSLEPFSFQEKGGESRGIEVFVFCGPAAPQVECFVGWDFPTTLVVFFKFFFFSDLRGCRSIFLLIFPGLWCC